MSLNRYAAKVDKSQPGIVKALEKAGAQVWVIGWPCDLLVRRGRLWFTMECKTPGAKPRKDQEKQQEFLRDTQTPVVHTPEEALRVVGAI